MGDGDYAPNDICHNGGLYQALMLGLVQDGRHHVLHVLSVHLWDLGTRDKWITGVPYGTEWLYQLMLLYVQRCAGIPLTG